MSSSVVGRIRVNQSVTSRVVSEFAAFRESLDRIEIFDNSIANDPSPPEKAAAVFARSALVGTTSAPCFAVLRQKVFDYNNRDFQSSQLQALVDGIGDKWLREQGGGLQLTVHKMKQSSISDILRDHTLSAKDIEVFSRVKELSGHRNLACFYVQSFLPVYGKVKVSSVPLDEIPQTESVRDLSAPTEAFTDGSAVVRIAGVRNARLICQALQGVPSAEFVSTLLRKYGCLTGDLLSCDPLPKIHNAVVINYRAIHYIIPESLHGITFHLEFL